MKIYTIFDKGKKFVFSISSAFELLEAQRLKKELLKP